MNQVTTLKSGAELKLQIAAFSVSMRLMKAIATELKAVQIDLTLNGQLDMAKLKEIDLPMDGIKNVACQLLASDAVEMALRECMKCCQYRGEAIRADTFEDENARGDYLPAAWEVIQVNLSPFFSGLGLKSLTNTAPADGSRK